MPGFHVENFGCRAARADGEAVSERLRSAGHRVQQHSEADVVIVNTCSVTAEADREARAWIRRTHRLNPTAKIVVTGCYAQRAPGELAGLEGVAAVVGNSHKALLPRIAVELMHGENGDRCVKGTGFSPYNDSKNIDGALAPEGPFVSLQSLLAHGAAPIFADDRFAHSFLEDAQVVPGEQTRPNLKIQEGCGNRCTFCVIPQTRGSSRSLPAEAVLKQVNGFVAAGGKELVLSGINLGRWGRDLRLEPVKVNPTLCRPLGRTAKDGAPAEGGAPEPRYGALTEDGAPGRMDGAQGSPRSSLAWLIRKIFAETELPRLRLSSIEPMDWDDAMLALMAEFGGARLCRHAHLPLQSGSDAVLRRMHRRYRPWHYAEKVAALIRSAGPELTLGADVMIGFPGETEREFEETLELVRALPFGYLHIFPFSARPGTRAWALHAESPVHAGAVRERLGALRSLASEKTHAHREQFVGSTVEAITLHTSADLAKRGLTRALSENFLPVEIRGDIQSNRLVALRLTGINGDAVLEAALGSENAQAEVNSFQELAGSHRA